MDQEQKDYAIIVQCHIVKERCSGYYCEKAFTERSGGFAGYGENQALRHLNITCGGCCGRALQRKLANFCQQIKKREGVEKERIVVHLSSCITKDNHHGPPCPHLDYLKELIGKLNLDVVDDTNISPTAERRREEGIYRS